MGIVVSQSLRFLRAFQLSLRRDKREGVILCRNPFVSLGHFN